MSNESYLKKADVSYSSDSSPKKQTLTGNDLVSRMEKENEELKLENKKLRFIIEEKNQEQIRMLKKEVMRHRNIDKKSSCITERMTQLLMIIFIVMNVLEIIFNLRSKLTS
jgi:regulator of replication initiation timing